MSDPSKGSQRLPRVAVVGHTNTGKTSLLRTLARDSAFGEVADRPGTTRDISRVELLADGRPAIEFLDTPGLEDSIELLERLDAMRGDARLDGPAQIERFLASDDAAERFAPEAKAIRAVLEADAAVYVIDSREPVRAKLRDELDVLARCGRPIVPVLNFTADPDARVAEWREQLARINLHAVAEFDTVVFDADGETRLFEKLRLQMDRFGREFDALIADRRGGRERLVRSDASVIAMLLIDASMMEEVVADDDRTTAERATAKLQDRLRERERRCVRDLLTLHRFRPDDVAAHDLPIRDGAWGIDLFSEASLRRYGPTIAGAVIAGSAAGATAGAAKGLIVDTGSAGATLGGATVAGAGIGAMIGAAVALVGGPGRRLMRRIRGGNELRAGEETLRLLAARQVELTRALLRRGHASVKPIRLDASSAAARGADGSRLPERWSNDKRDDAAIGRTLAILRARSNDPETVSRVTAALEPLLRAAPPPREPR